MRFLIVCASGAVGCGLRYLVAQWLGHRTFPYATLLVNVVGSFLITFVVELALRLADFPPNLRLALTTGFLGGLTTYSSFNHESLAMVLDGNALRGVTYVVVTLVACAAAGLLGLVSARALS
ncbi:MAG TPA: CrcB family protein [Kofleriaceae bacterium]